MRRALAAGLLAAALGCAGPGGEAAPEERGIALRFGWPEGLAAEVELVRSVRRSDPAGPVATTQRIAWRWRVEPASDGPAARRLVAEDLRVQDPETEETLAWEALEGARAGRVAALAPTLRVDGAGRVQEARAPDGRALGPEGRERALSLWRALVAGWAGRAVEPGASEAGEGLRRLALFGGLDVPVRTSRGAGQWLPCEAEAVQARCLELEARARAAEGAAAGHPTLRRLRLEEESYLVSEPQGLLPHYLETTRRLEVGLGSAEREAVALETLEQRVYRFRWE